LVKFNPKALTAVLDSKFATYYISVEFAYKHLAGWYLAINRSTIDQLPLVKIPNIISNQLSDLGKAIFKLKKESKLKNIRFQNLVSNEYDLRQWKFILNLWWKLHFDDFASRLRLKLSLHQNDELIQLFEKYQTELVELDNQIKKMTKRLINSSIKSTISLLKKSQSWKVKYELAY
jgi:hypothetical protein